MVNGEEEEEEEEEFVSEENDLDEGIIRPPPILLLLLAKIEKKSQFWDLQLFLPNTIGESNLFFLAIAFGAVAVAEGVAEGAAD